MLRNLKTNSLQPVKVDTCFEFIGYEPNTEIFKGVVDLSEKDYVIVNELMETSVPGVFSAGDVNEKFLKQVATAVGDGAIAGVMAEKFLAENEVFYNQILNPDKPGIVFVYDATCERCRQVLPIIEEVAERSEGKFRTTKVDVYKSKGIARRLGVKGTPVLVLIKDGKVEKTIHEDLSIDAILKEVKLMSS